MPGTFTQRIEHLQDQVGRGKLVGAVEVNQVYAAWQHFHPEFFHPDGGGAYYLSDPLLSQADSYMGRLAEKAITEEGSSLKDAMKDNMEDLSDQVYAHAPWEFADLRASGHPTVTQDGETFYDRAPMVGRLSEDDLRAKNKLSRLLWPDRYLR